MNPPPQIHACRGGSTLMEVIIAVGVLAVAIPMVFGALAESGKSGLASQAETRSTWMIPICMDEIRASRDGLPQYFAPTAPGQAFPPSGEVWALAFSADGKPVGRLSKALYESGARELDGKNIRYIASIRAEALATNTGTAPMMRVDVSLEYPAFTKAAMRGKIDFHTRIR